jgi:hypothetical protein
MKIPYKYLLFAPWVSLAIGFVLNSLAIAANHGQMAVLWPGGCADAQAFASDAIHTCMTPATHWNVISDWIVVNHYGVVSPGDLFLWASEYTKLPALYIWIALIIKDLN